MKNYSQKFIRKLAREIVNAEWVTVIERPGSPVLDWDGNVPYVNWYFSQLTQIPVTFSGFMFFKNKLMVKKEDYDKVSEYILRACEKNPDTLRRLAKKAEEDCDFLRAVSSRITKNDLNTAINILDLYGRTIHHFRWVFNASDVLEKRIRQAMEKPIKDNFITKYTLELDLIRSEIKKNKSLAKSLQKKDFVLIQRYPDIHKMIIKFISKYFWIKVFHHQGNFLSFEEFMEELAETLDRVKKQTKEINIIRDIQLLRSVIFLRTHIAESLNSYSTAMTKPALEKLASDVGISYEEITFLTVNELKKMSLTRKLPISKSVLRDRILNGYACINLNEKYYFISGKNLESLHKWYDKLAALKNSPAETGLPSIVIKGLVGNKGLAKGTARVVINSNEFQKLNKGDILVANATTPNYIPIMAKAAAFVTDEGGITSHAAIVSRELGKPCVIGTKNATKILKDGDFVEVDANNGVVRIINKSK